MLILTRHEHSPSPNRTSRLKERRVKWTLLFVCAYGALLSNDNFGYFDQEEEFWSFPEQACALVVLQLMKQVGYAGLDTDHGAKPDDNLVAMTGQGDPWAGEGNDHGVETENRGHPARRKSKGHGAGSGKGNHETEIGGQGVGKRIRDQEVEREKDQEVKREREDHGAEKEIEGHVAKKRIGDREVGKELGDQGAEREIEGHKVGKEIRGQGAETGINGH